MAARPADFARIYDMFNASISERVDCGRHCAPLNGGSPVCCSTDNAIPIVAKAEWRHLKQRTDIWKPFRPRDASARQVVADLHETCKAIECKVAPACQRDNRTLACRAFPFFPYFSRDRDLVGVAYYWIFEDRCWILSNLHTVEAAFIKELIATYTFLFERDDDEREAFVGQSVSARRVFSRWKRPLPVFAPDGTLKKVLPKSDGELIDAELRDFSPHGPYASEAAFRRAVTEAGGDGEAKDLVLP